MSESCIYEGSILHRRFEPPSEFRHRLALAYLDLDEAPALLGGRLVRSSPGLLRFRREDYHGDACTRLDEAVRDTVEQRLGARPRGPVRLLAQLRSFGHCFNPVSFFYCMREGGEDVEAILAEVTNTPWKERHAYVFAGGEGSARRLSGTLPKMLHVSPFMPMNQTYELRAGAPRETLSVHIESRNGHTPAFEATLSLRRRELSSAGARRMIARYPLASARVLALIYAHALALRVKGARVHPHVAKPGAS